MIFKQATWVKQLKSSLVQTRENLSQSLSGIFNKNAAESVSYDQLRNTLLMADMGPNTTDYLLSVAKKNANNPQQLTQALSGGLFELIHPLEKPLDISGYQPFVIMVVGVNGSGKTTSIGKIAKHFRDRHKTVLLGAADTFRAAAYEQLAKLAQFDDITVVSKPGGDSAAVCYDAIAMACTQHIDVVLIDTAGRLPTQFHLMDEIKKVKRVAQKALPNAPHEVLLILDANTGANSLSQVKLFNEALELTGLVLTKLDGTAKGGIIAAVAQQYAIPLRFVGFGEGIDDLYPFVARDYVDAMFLKDKESHAI